MRYELSDHEWSVIRVMLPTKSRGKPRVDDRRVLNGIFWVLRSGAPWRDLPDIYGPRTTCYNRFVRWRKAGVWESIMAALTAAPHAAVQMIDTSLVRVHQHAACIIDSGSQAVGIFWILRTGSPWRDLPERYGPYTTVYNRFNRWAKAGIWVRIFEALAARSPKSLQFIDSSIVRAHQHAAGGKKGAWITPSAVLVAD
jgi:transposase